MMYLVATGQQPQGYRRDVRIGWVRHLESFMVTVTHDPGGEVYRYEYERADQALEDAARQAGVDRITSVWLYRLVGDRDIPGTIGLPYAPDPVVACPPAVLASEHGGAPARAPLPLPTSCVQAGAS